jgi:hypothetical protein
MICYLNGFDDKGKTGGGKATFKAFPTIYLLKKRCDFEKDERRN